MNPETPRSRVGGGVLAALCLFGVCCSLVASCGDMYIGGIYRAVGGSGGGSTTGGDGGTGGGGGTTAGECGTEGVCMLGGGGGGGPVLLWIGPKGKAPAMGPDRAQRIAWSQGYAHPIVPGCGACTCGTVSHTCTLPTSMTAYDVLGCPAGQPGLPFDAASPWDGKCDDSHPILAPNNVQSLMVGAIDLVESCKPSPTFPVPGMADWEIEAKAFDNGLSPPTCMGGHGWQCAPTIDEPGDPPEGFHLCMMHENMYSGNCYGEKDFTEPYVFYRGFEESRTCDACTCTPPAVKGTCTSVLSVYQNADKSCNGPAANPGQSISSEMSTCIQINPAKQPLGSKSATDPQYTPVPGEPSCQPGGGALHGSATPSKTDAATFCCLPSKTQYPPSNHQ